MANVNPAPVSVNPEDDLMRFRTAWLSAIALAWQDNGSPGFKKLLLQNAVQALEKLPFAFHWPWSAVNLSVVEGNDFVWKERPKPGWKWPVPQTGKEFLVMNMPLLPKAVPGPKDPVGRGEGVDISDEDLPSALADYYRDRPTLFGSSDGAPMSPDAFVAKSSVFVGPGTDFTNFEVAMIVLLANRWKSRKMLGADPIGPKDLRASLKKVEKKYRIPWVLLISVKNDPNIRWDKEHRVWKNATPHLLQLELPPAPTNISSRTVALAEYNATGSEFPFTCCCI